MIKDIVADARQRMQKTVDDLTRDMASIRTGRASVSLLDHITVDYYGTPTPISQVASLHVPEPTLITVQPWDLSQLHAIEKAIMASDLGITPSNDGRIIRIPIPPLTQERRQSLAKHLGKIAEEHRTAVRQIRREANERLKKACKNKEISEDDEHRGLDEIQKVTDAFIEKIDALTRQKEKEILEG
ncbi:MAG TPA: ribosome recycling factor [Acidobacteriota bacterium]|nr:ribosome recycling factor [Acidobacteriota bacterium]